MFQDRMRLSTACFMTLLIGVSCGLDGFWMTAELIRVDWKEDCLTTGGCSQPRFKIMEEIPSMKERVSISWPVTEQLQEVSRQFVSHWTAGLPDEVHISAQVVGNDPVYGFPRVCDTTATNRPFKGPGSDYLGRIRRHEYTVESVDGDDKKKIVQLIGRCFNASFMVQKHTERCPWCPDPADLSLIANELPEENSSSSALFGLSNTQFLHAGILTLAVITTVVTLLLCLLAVVYCRQKKNIKSRNVNVKPRHHYVYQKSDLDERRYDAPWEQSYRPLTTGMFSNSSSRGETTTTSPLDSSSSIGFASSYRGLVPPPSTRIYHQIGSPNSSTNHDDSGLESV